MLLKTQGIILNNVKYGDKKVISKIYTLHYGLQTYAINFGTTQKSKIKPAHLQPLNQVDLEIFFKEKNEVNRVTEIRILYPYTELNRNINKNCIAVFLNEVLLKSLRESGSNEILFDFVTFSFQQLDKKEKDYNSFHLFFLIELSQHLGFFAQNNFSDSHTYFNLMDGRFEEKPPPHANYLDINDSAVFSRMLANYNEYEHSGLINSAERTKQLNLLLQYYRFHIPGFNELKTLSVLQSTLAG
ncbi:MAG: DNA repair protein RecO [Bacteroidia bacterium]|nr:DNA repair protein RecO [Bacteroidia bacterium]